MQVCSVRLEKSVKHFRKAYFDVWVLKLEILMCFDTVLCYLLGFTVYSKTQVISSDGVEYSTSEYEYEYLKKLRVRVRVLVLKNVLEYEYRKKVRVRVRVLLEV